MGLVESGSKSSGHEKTPKASYDQEYKRGMAELHSKIALTGIFVNGAALTSSGMLQYPYPMPSSQLDLLSDGNRILFEEGRIVRLQPKEIGAQSKDPSHPPVASLIPPKSNERLVVKKHFRGYGDRKRELAPSLLLLHGIDKNGNPLTDAIGFHEFEAFRRIVAQALLSKELDTKDLPPPKAIARKVLSEMAYETGLGELEAAVQRMKEEAGRS